MANENTPIEPQAQQEPDNAQDQGIGREHLLPDGLYPIVITVLYLILGFVFHAWHPGWLIFLTIPLYYWHPESRILFLCNPVLITLIYLVMGFYFHMWHPGWLIFFAVPAAYIIDANNRKPQK